MLRVLVVEDDEANRDETVEVIRAADVDADIAVAGDRDTAYRLLAEHEFDLVVCDLKIPAAPDDLDSNEVYGLAVHARAQEVCPGTPLIFLTGKATPTNVQRQLAYGAVAEYYGMPPTPMVQLAVKDSHRSEVGLINNMASGIRTLQNCHAEVEGPEISELLRRAILMYAKRIDAVKVTIWPLSGLSGAEVARASFGLDNGQTRAVLVKLQDRRDALDELARYDLNVPNKLRVGYYAPNISPSAEYGLRKKMALFYSLAQNTKSLFDIATEDPDKAARIIAALQDDHAPWTSEQHFTEVSVGDLRLARIPNEHPRCAPLLQVEWRPKVESAVIDLQVATTHGDLHGMNLLVDASERATLIDYGDVGLASSALDPITLELSFVFHAARPAQSDWPTVEQLRSWHDMDVYAAGSRYEPVLRACRTWANAVASSTTVLATAYTHAARQLKYSDVNPEYALAVAGSAALELLRCS